MSNERDVNASKFVCVRGKGTRKWKFETRRKIYGGNSRDIDFLLLRQINRTLCCRWVILIHTRDRLSLNYEPRRPNDSIMIINLAIEICFSSIHTDQLFVLWLFFHFVHFIQVILSRLCYCNWTWLINDK